jgi:hypothetical protein
MLKILTALTAVLALSCGLAFAHGNATHLTGTITAIEGDHVQIKDQAGKMVIFMIQKNTKFLKGDKPSTRAELKAGTRVLVDAKMDEKMKMYAAEEITIGVTTPPKSAPKTPAK